LGKPDDVDLTIELKDWLFALEGPQEMAERWWFDNHEGVVREERCWHTTFQSLRVKAKSSPKHELNVKGRSQEIQKYPVELVTVRMCIFLLSFFSFNLAFEFCPPLVLESGKHC
jgi:hypothetical protein